MQTVKLSKELETQQQENEALEARASEAEKKISELNFKLADVSVCRCYWKCIKFWNDETTLVLPCSQTRHFIYNFEEF